jgi:penicillin-binding protein 1A
VRGAGGRIALCLLVLAGSACAWQPPAAPRVDASDNAQTSKVFAADGTLITELHAEQNRETVPLDRIGAPLKDSVVAIEDERFWKHRGVDMRSVLRAAYEDTSSGKVVQGGSTITQQYVKNALVGNERNLHRKVREASLAFQVERAYPKTRILEGYLNTIYFGNGAYGAQAAANVYFGTTADKLDAGQAALLAGIIRSPSSYDPYDHPSDALARRNVVLDKRVELGQLTPDQATFIKATPLGVIRQVQQRYPAANFVEKVKQLILDDPTFGATPEERQRTLFEGGLRIYTTVDLRRQRQAEDAVAQVLTRQGDPAAAVVSVEAGTGFVRALVGGRDFFGGGSFAKFDLATQGRRQAGSSFKPLVLAAALSKGIPLSKQYPAPAQLTIELPPPSKPWDVGNYEDEAPGQPIDLVEATVHSINTVYAQLIVDVGPQPAVDLAKKMGIASPLQAVPSAVLGTNDVTPLDMAAAYSTFANRGLRVPPTFLLKVTRSDGTVLFEHHHQEQRVLSRDVVDTEVPVLEQVVQRGTGVRAQLPAQPVAGKTGTAQEWRDAWFVGFSPQLTTAVWVGFSQGQISMKPPTTPIRVTGGTWPAQIWQLFMANALHDVAPIGFPVTPTTVAPPPPPAPALVPNVVGIAIADAEAQLTRAGFTVERRAVPASVYPDGFVVRQTPLGESLAAPASKVVLEVADRNVVATDAPVPNVLGMSAAQARSTLASAGFGATTTVVSEPDPRAARSRPGVVWSQQPVAGYPWPRTSPVQLSVNPS